MSVPAIVKLIKRHKDENPLFNKLYTLANHFYSDSLYRNSVYLMLSSLIMAFLGFFFWTINARLYSAADIGIATALISTTSLIVNISLLGFNNAIIRYLPKWPNKNEYINIVFLYISLVSLIVGIIFIAFAGFFAPKLQPVFLDIGFAVFFAVFIVVSSINTITDSLFISYRSTHFILIIYTIMSLSRIIFALLMPKSLHNATFYEYAVSIVLAAILSILFLNRYRDYRPSLHWRVGSLGETWKFSFANYISSIVAGVPTMILPLFILNRIGAAQAAYHYIGMMIASIIFVIPQSITQSLFSEGSHNEKNILPLTFKSLRLTLLLVTIPIVIFIVFGKFLLVIFGKEYSLNVYAYLCLLVLSAYPLAINYVCFAVVKLKQLNRALIYINVFNTIIFIILYFYLIRLGLWGVGIAWLTGNIIAAAIYVIVVLRALKK